LQAYTSANFLPQSIFHVLHEVKSREPAKFQQHSAPAQHVRTTLKLLRHDTPDFIVAPNQADSVASWHIQLQSCWLQNLGNATGVGKPVSTSYIRDVDKLRQRLIDRQTDDHWSSDWSVVRAWVMARRGHWDIWHSPMFFSVELHCWSIRFILYKYMYDVSFICWIRCL